MQDVQEVQVTVIVGAGIAGLSSALRIKTLFPDSCVYVFEARPRTGGRIRSVYDEERAFLQDAGSWRVHESHTRMKALAQELGIQLTQTHSLPSEPTPGSPESLVNQDVVPGFTKKQSLAFTYPLPQVDEIERMSGYVGTFDGGRRTYRINAQKTGVFYTTTPCGMQAFTNRLLEECKAKGVYITTNARVYSIKKLVGGIPGRQTYRVKVAFREENKYPKREIVCQRVVIACPPHAVEKIKTNFELALRPALSAVKSVPLVRVYVNTKQPIEHPVHIVTGDLLGHIISTSSNKLMVVYAGGWLTGWHQKSWMQNKAQYMDNIRRLYIQNRTKHPELLPPEQIDFQNPVCQCFWEHAVHFWKPAALYRGKPPVDFVVQPHAKKLPGVYLVNEAWSSEQGWSEGALEMVDKMLERINGQRQRWNRLKTTKTTQHLIFDGRLLYVQKWMNEHPGSKQAIINHLDDKDVTQLMLHVHNHSTEVFAYILGLQDGWI